MSELRELRSYGEPGAMVYLTDCVELMGLMPAGCVDVLFADPPYRLSGGGVSVQSGRLAPVNKGEWDRSMVLREGPRVECPVAYGSTAQAVINEGNRLFILYDVSVHDPIYKRV